MFIIKSCEKCGRRLRFPIDKGRIRVSCACGGSFVADPDNPDLFKNAVFDVRERPGQKDRVAGVRRPSFRKMDFSFFRGVQGRFISRALDISYKIRNFKILPSSEQRKMLAVLAIAMMALALVSFLICAATLYRSPVRL